MNEYSISTNIVAWWGASIATLVLIWDIIKWLETGPKIEYAVQSNMKTLGFGDDNNKIWITVRATNIGDQSTTITNLCVRYYKSYLKKILNKIEMNGVIGNPGITQRIPFSIKPGDIWDGRIEQTLDVKKMASDGYLYCDLYHSQSKKPISKRIKIKNNCKRGYL